MEVKYGKITQETIKKRIEDLLQNERLQKMGIRKIQLGITTYNYPIDMIQIGHGEKEIFIVGGTHSSEIIGIDFTTQLIEQLPFMEEYDPNEITLKIIPLQNPEGFNLVEQTYSHIDENKLEQAGKEYYTRYKIDDIIVRIINEINGIKRNSKYIEDLKQLIKISPNWQRLQAIIPQIRYLIKSINESQDYIELLFSLRKIISKLDEKNIEDLYLKHFIEILITGYDKEIDITQIPKLYQKMFEEIDIKNLSIRNKKMKEKMQKAYIIHPKGSQIGHDSTGTFINLNANHLLSPGIEVIKQKKIRYMTGTKSNIRNYIEGPNGLPCIDVDNFEYAIENKVLYRLLKKSEEEGKYLATILYHGTGGMIYYMPHETLTKDKFQEFYTYNKELTNAYNEGIEQYGTQAYKTIDESDTTGYGDLLARTFKGVLMVELSRMGGNPIGPYGDIDNVNRTISENISAIKNVLKFINTKRKNK